MNYFQLFDLPELFTINMKKLLLKFHKLQKQYHPDANHSSSKIEKNKFLRKTIDINKGYQILKDPIERAKYLLRLNSYNFELKKNNIFKKNFLHEQLKVYEKLDTLKKSSKNESKLNNFTKEIKKKEKYYLLNVEIFLNQKNWNLAATTLYKYLFYKKIKKKINEFNIHQI
ncbi:MAG: Fe-S protein assembly co-chaperone HscB [Buchnera aphidicola (Nurudea yanoniella)]